MKERRQKAATESMIRDNFHVSEPESIVRFDIWNTPRAWSRGPLTNEVFIVPPVAELEGSTAQAFPDHPQPGTMPFNGSDFVIIQEHDKLSGCSEQIAGCRPGFEDLPSGPRRSRKLV